MISISLDGLTITGDTTGTGQAAPSGTGRPAHLNQTSVFYEREAAGLAVKVVAMRLPDELVRAAREQRLLVHQSLSFEKKEADYQVLG